MIRTDATSETGAGHAMRCLTVADAWLAQRHGPVSLLGDIEFPFVAERVGAMDIERLTTVDQLGADSVLLVDSYDEMVRERFASASARVRVIADDVGAVVPRGYHVVWNPNAYGDRLPYHGFAGIRLSGADFVPVRDGLPRWKGETGGGTLAALGGGGLVASVDDALASLVSIFPQESFFRVGETVRAGWASITPSEFWTRAARCERAIVAAGVTTWEFSAMGTPVVLLVLADNQHMVGEWAGASRVPVVDCRGHVGAQIRAAIADVLHSARPLPRIENGAPRLVRKLASLASGA
jgi:hypothetical protein